MKQYDDLILKEKMYWHCKIADIYYLIETDIIEAKRKVSACLSAFWSILLENNDKFLLDFLNKFKLIQEKIDAILKEKT